MRELLTRYRGRALVVVGLLLAVPTAFYAFVVPLTPARMARDSVALFADFPLWSALAAAPLPIPQDSTTLGLLLILMAALAFGLYGAAVLLSWSGEGDGRSRLAVLILTAALWLIPWLALPNINTDIFNYIVRGRLAADHSSNPYYTAADEFPDDPLYPYASQAYTRFQGGKLPAWMFLNIGLAAAAGDNPVVNLLLYRGVLILLGAANLLLIDRISHKLFPQRRLAPLVVYAWNPIVVVLGGSKVDTVMVTYLLAGVFLLLSGRRLAAVAAWALSAFTKLVTLPLAAVYMLDHVRRRQWRRFLLESAVYGATVILIYLPFAPNIGHYARLLGLAQYANSVTGTAASVASPALPLDLLLKIGFVLVVLAVGLRQDGSPLGLQAGWATAMFYFCIFLIPISFSHYLITLIAVVSLAPRRFSAALVLVMSAATFLINTWHTSFSAAFPSPDLFAARLYTLYVSVVIVAALALGAFLVWRRPRSLAGASQEI